MAYFFNPPPQWPKPPEGWEPDPGWRPDPAWGPAPEGWIFWVDENGVPVASGDGAAQTPQDPRPPQGSATAQGSTAPQGSAAPKVPAAPQNSTLSEGADPRGAARPSVPAAETTQSPGTGPAGSGAGAFGASEGASGSGARTRPLDGSGGLGSSGPDEPSRKKNFFTTGAGLAILLGSVLVLLIVVVVVMVGTSLWGGKNVVPWSSSSSSASGQDSPTQAAPAPAHETKAIKTLNGTGNRTVDAGLSPGTVYYVEYAYAGDSNFVVWGNDKSGERNGLLANEIHATSGSHWVNADDLHPDVTGFTVETGEGEQWELKVFTGQGKVVEADHSYDLSGSQAISYTSGKATEATLKNTSDHYIQVVVTDLKGKFLGQELVEAGKSRTVRLPASSQDEPTLIQIEAQGMGDAWSLSLR